MDIIKMTRELGKAIQADERYINFQKASEANDNDTALQNQIKDFNLKRINLNEKLRNNEKGDQIQALNAEIKEMYNAIMNNENMRAYEDSKAEFDTLISQVSTIINSSANGDDPETCPAESSCGGSCSSCSGCH
jgi:cell fate (sporulation/competence/biofilm development) regulator YlbF (YheA/YmcA/DUF963 family)